MIEPGKRCTGSAGVHYSQKIAGSDLWKELIDEQNWE
jgi:hypothetical protein